MCGTKCTVQANDLLRLGIAKFPWWAFLVILDDSNSGRFPKINLREFLGHPDNKIFGVNRMLRSVYTTPPLPYPPLRPPLPPRCTLKSTLSIEAEDATQVGHAVIQ